MEQRHGVFFQKDVPCKGEEINDMVVTLSVMMGDGSETNTTVEVAVDNSTRVLEFLSRQLLRRATELGDLFTRTVGEECDYLEVLDVASSRQHKGVDDRFSFLEGEQIVYYDWGLDADFDPAYVSPCVDRAVKLVFGDRPEFRNPNDPGPQTFAPSELSSDVLGPLTTPDHESEETVRTSGTGVMLEEDLGFHDPGKVWIIVSAHDSRNDAFLAAEVLRARGWSYATAFLTEDGRHLAVLGQLEVPTEAYLLQLWVDQGDIPGDYVLDEGASFVEEIIGP